MTVLIILHNPILFHILLDYFRLTTRTLLFSLLFYFYFIWYKAYLNVLDLG